MIDFVEGKIAYIDSEYIVVETGGIGYRLFCPNPYSFIQQQGQVTRLYTHHHVREDAIHLYGFENRDQREMFRKLLEVTGIGPKVALAIMAAATPEQLVLAIEQENVTYLTKVPGIGKKTAQRIILDLKDKLKGFTPTLIIPATSTADLTSRSQADEALEALEALGYSDSERQQVKAPLIEQASAGATTEQLIKQGLTLLMRG